MMNNNEFKVPVYDLSGKVAIVTGATKGLGYGIAMKLAAAGAKVVITSRHQEECDAVAQEIKELGMNYQKDPTSRKVQLGLSPSPNGGER